MDLFVVNRYEGEEPEIAESTAELEAKRLQKILRKAEKRKRAREIEKVEEVEEPKEKTKKNKQVEESVKEEKNDQENEVKDEDKKDEQKPVDNAPSFQILGEKTFKKHVAANRVLPRWLSHPKIISSSIKESKTKVTAVKCINKRLQRLLKANEMKYLFPVQAEVVPFVLKQRQLSGEYWPRDVCVSAATGSGKTLAFALPILQSLETVIVRRVRALVVLPVRELAVQVYKVFRKYSANSPVTVASLVGTLPLQDEQKLLVRKTITSGYISNVDIIVTTPGRLVEHLNNTPGFDLSHLEFLVLDEADRLINIVQDDWLFHLERHLAAHNVNLRGNTLNVDAMKTRKRAPQKILASATLTQDPDKLHSIGLFKPMLFTCVSDEVNRDESRNTFVGKYTLPDGLKENYVVTTVENKPIVLYHLIKSNQFGRVLCFASSSLEAHRLTLLLRHLSNNQLNVEEMTGKMSTKTRAEHLNKFTSGKCSVLISTDALARGMDLANIDCVISYSVPKHVKTYIHRIGRTARAGNVGVAITIIMAKQRQYFLKMVREHQHDQHVDSLPEITEIPVDDAVVESMADDYKRALDMLSGQVTKEEEKRVKRVQNLRLKSSNNARTMRNRRKIK